MANIAVNLPTAAANGPGAWVDVSAMGADKLIVASGGDMVGTINIEISNEAVATKGAPIASIQNRGVARWAGAARWMRANITGYRQGTAPDVDVGANNDGTQRANLPATAGDGDGAAVDVSAFGIIKTVTLHGPFRGTVTIEFSQDAVTWGPALPSYTAPGQFTAIVPCQWLRATRSGVPEINPGLPVIDVAGVNDVGGSGSGFEDAVIFDYVATGAEGTDFMVTLPAARVDDDYLVISALQGVTGDYLIDLPDSVPGDRTTTQFRVVTTAGVPAGDRLVFLVANP